MKKIYCFAFAIALMWSQACVQAPQTKTKPSDIRFLLEHKVRPAQISNGKVPVLVLLHGLRSNEDDLFALAPMLDQRLLIVSVRAPFDAGGGRYKWYDYQSNPTGKAIIDAEQMEESRTTLIEFIDQLTVAYNVDKKQVFVGGFSQGAMMSYMVGLTQPDKVKGIASFSGNIPDAAKTKMASVGKFSDLSVFISHGKKDPVLPFADALSDKDFLEKKDIKTNFHSYETAHTMNRQNILDFQAWMSKEL